MNGPGANTTARNRHRTAGAVRRLLVLMCVLAGCAGPLEPGRLPTPEEACAYQRGWFRAGVCHTAGGQ
jgi:hypothetical protein